MILIQTKNCESETDKMMRVLERIRNVELPDVPVVKDRKDTTMTHLNAHNADTGHVGDDVVLLHCVKIRLLTKTDLGDREREKERRTEKKKLMQRCTDKKINKTKIKPCGQERF